MKESRSHVGCPPVLLRSSSVSVASSLSLLCVVGLGNRRKKRNRNEGYGNCTIGCNVEVRYSSIVLRRQNICSCWSSAVPHQKRGRKCCLNMRKVCLKSSVSAKFVPLPLLHRCRNVNCFGDAVGKQPTPASEKALPCCLESKREQRINCLDCSANRERF